MVGDEPREEIRAGVYAELSDLGQSDFLSGVWHRPYRAESPVRTDR
jgi:hypothetical protein